MKYKVTIILFLVVYECNGQGSIIGNILSSVHQRAEGVAGALLGGLNHLGRNRQNRPQDVPQKGPEETIIIVVEQPSQGNGNNQGPMHHGPPHHHHHHPHHGRGPPPFNDDSRPPPPHGHGRGPPFNDDSRPPPPHGHGRGPPFNDDSRPPPPHHHGGPPHNNGPPPPPPHDHYHQRPNEDRRPEYDNQNQGHNQNEYGNNQNGNNYQNNQNGRPYVSNNGNSDGNFQPNPQGTQENQDKNYYDKPTTEYIKTPNPTMSNQLPKQKEPKTTEKPSDRPLFVPLNPNEYVYGGDKIDISAPKRETDKTKTEEADDENFDIDIRLKNE